MSVKDLNRVATTLFGPSASVVETPWRLRIGDAEYRLPQGTQADLQQALDVAYKLGPEVLDRTVTVSRQPAGDDGGSIPVAFTDLTDFHVRTRSGGRARSKGRRQYLYARMWFTSIPVGADFGPHVRMALVRMTSSSASVRARTTAGWVTHCEALRAR